MSNQNKTHCLKTTILSLSFATLGIASFSHAAQKPFAQIDNQSTKISVKGGEKKCGEGKCGDSKKTAKVTKVKETQKESTSVLIDDSQKGVSKTEATIKDKKPKEVEKKCGS